MLLHELIEQFLVGYNHLLNIENRGKDTTFFSILQTNLQKSKLAPKRSQNTSLFVTGKE
jgi:hypothetical protein